MFVCVLKSPSLKESGQSGFVGKEKESCPSAELWNSVLLYKHGEKSINFQRMKAEKRPYKQPIHISI